MQSDRTIMFAIPALLAGVGLTTALFIWPNYRAARDCEIEVATLLTKIETLEVQARLLDQLQDELAQSHDRIENELKLIPESADLASLMRKLSLEVDRVSVLDQTFTAGSVTEAIAGRTDTSPSGPATADATSSREADIQAMPLTVDMESRFDAVLALIRNAETLNRLVRITSVRISSKRESQSNGATASGDSPVLKASIGLEAIFQPASAHGSAPVRDSSAQRIGSAAATMRAPEEAN
jgi:Tfp pilus assembly protein PilO